MSFEIPPALYTSDVFASVSLILALFLARLIAGRALRRRVDLTQQVAPFLALWGGGSGLWPT